jgi:hypothetical protein
MVTLHGWKASHRGGALRLVGWCSYDGGATRLRVSTARVVAVEGRRAFGDLEARLCRGAVVRAFESSEYRLGSPEAA